MTTEKKRSFLIHIAYYGVLTVAACAVLKYALPMLAPFVAAVVIAYVLKGPINFLTNKCHIPHKFSAILCTTLFYCIMGIALTLLGVQAISGAANLLGQIPKIYSTHVYPFFTSLLTSIETFFLKLDVTVVNLLAEVGGQLLQSLGQLVSSLSVKAMSMVSGLASAVPGLFIELVLLIISTYFITIDYERLTGFCMRQLGEKGQNIFVQVKEYVIGTLFVCIRSYFIIMSITFVELAICLSLLKIPHAVLIAFLIAIFDILPVLGTGGIMLPWTAFSAVQGNFSLALGLLLTYLVITIIRNIIEPKIVGGQLGLHPVVTLASMSAGVQFFGIIGLFGFPIGLSLLRYLDEHGVIKVFK